jgi:hypothetical protein
MTMDNVQNCDNYIDILSSQTYRSCYLMFFDDLMERLKFDPCSGTSISDVKSSMIFGPSN